MSTGGNSSQFSQMNDTYVDVRGLLKRFAIRPDKKLGQNFLLDRAALDKVVRAADLKGNEQVVEVGAGLGSLTIRLANVAATVFAIEFDRRLIPPLNLALRRVDNVHVIHTDALKLEIAELVGESPFSVVANIPYYISSSLIRKFLDAPRQPERIVLTIQKEVAQRVVAPQGKFGLLTLSVKIFGDPEIAGYIPAKAFFPTPQVDSAILVIRVQESPNVPPELIKPIFSLAKAGFGQKRKQLRNSLSSGFGEQAEWAERLLVGAGIDPKKRAQELGLEDWAELAKQLALLRGEGGG